MPEPSARRPVRSYTRREGRMTAAQRRALETLWARYGCTAGSGTVDLDALFGARASRVIEIGFGDGEALARMAAKHPELQFVGIDVHRPGLGHLLMRIDDLGLHNLRLMEGDAAELAGRLPEAACARIQIFFPDPWPKKRHHKRRLLQPAFAGVLAAKLEPGGRLHVATDWEDYALHALQVLEADPRLVNTAGPHRFAERPDYRETTKFERRGQGLGHRVRELIFERLPRD